ncbi:nucleotidyl transferase AbiEii/AbiGii toxin family protein [Saccharopolyspora sp. 5N708]|uniref:nucleotidyl transferase AbiEii/AbiGii toxin family protein n=1 Tax=Saccharopolyspora sp. 5N708 TaxID=3457424 RepID=UPI003FD3A27D
MLDPDEEQAVAEQFGVARAQVRRDHLISHLLAALSQHLAEQVLFFGDTALSRTFIPGGRLSEDIDLIALSGRRATAEALERSLVRAVRREYPGLTWNPPLTTVRDVEPAVLAAPDGTTVRIQLLNHTGYAPWPTERRALVQRYSDAPPATLLVPTRESSAAWKTTAWVDRAASRDLYDLWLLANVGALDAAAAELFRKYGPTNKMPTADQFATPPDEATWQRELAGQTRLRITAVEALGEVRRAWQEVRES